MSNELEADTSDIAKNIETEAEAKKSDDTGIDGEFEEAVEQSGNHVDDITMDRK